MQRQVHKHPQKWSRPNSPYRRRIKRGHPYPNLGGGIFLSYPYKMYCRKCHTANKTYRMGGGETCPTCGNDRVLIPSRVKLPRITASKNVWNEFEKRFKIKELYEANNH